jgi:predicted transposase YbfD/YdcC
MDSPFEVHFGSIKDPRNGNATRHLLSDIIGVAVITILCRAEGWEEMEEFGKAKEAFLRNFLRLPHGIPSHDTMERVFKRISPGQVEECFRSWVSGLGLDHGHIALDGKSRRGSGDDHSGKAIVHMVSASASREGISLGQETVDCKENEHKAMMRILDMLDLCGCMITIDAMGNQRKIAKKIIDGEGDYLTGLKDNQRTIQKETEALFNSIGPQDSHVSHDKGHGRFEKRTCHVIYKVDMLDPLHEWPGLKALVKVESEITKGGKMATQNRYYLSSRNASASELNDFVRNHWSIENSQH